MKCIYRILETYKSDVAWNLNENIERRGYFFRIAHASLSVSPAADQHGEPKRKREKRSRAAWQIWYSLFVRKINPSTRASLLETKGDPPLFINVARPLFALFSSWLHSYPPTPAIRSLPPPSLIDIGSALEFEFCSATTAISQSYRLGSDRIRARSKIRRVSPRSRRREEKIIDEHDADNPVEESRRSTTQEPEIRSPGLSKFGFRYIAFSWNRIAID